VGYARSKINDVDFRDRLKPFLLKHASEDVVEQFLDICYYRAGQYDDSDALSGVVEFAHSKLHKLKKGDLENRVFYFALPPSTFLDMAKTVHAGGMSAKGFNRLILEKPFGHDTESAIKLGDDLGKLFSEDYLYRIDHYLGKEMVQNVITLRFANSFLEPIWNRDYISSVTISFKEDIGTMGRGGYFDNYGIIRDVMQNHLMQVLCVIAMEPPVRVSGPNYSNYVRDEKVKVLHCIEPWTLEK
jgi:glucose-6-phosphate 1-dehydrogenase